MIPHPFTQAPYFHRSLNPKKNVETGFTTLPSNESMARYYKRTKIDGLNDINIVGTPRMMEKKDISAVYSLYKKQSERYQIAFKMSQEELAHHLMPRDEVMYTIVIENDKKVTDFISFYHLPSQILKKEHHNHTMMKVSFSV